MNDRLYRSVDDRVIAGVCGGLAVRMGIDPSLVRIGYAVVAFVTGIFPLLVLYVIMAAVVPEEPTGFAGAGRPPAPPGPDAVPGWTPPGGGDASAPGVAGMPGVPDAGAPASSVPGEAPGWAGAPGVQPAPRERRGDPLVGVIGGLVLVGLGTWFLVRDRVDIDWGIVWAAGLMAVGVVVVVAAFVRPRR